MQRVTHILIDGVRYPNAFERLYARDDLADIEPLYLTTRWRALPAQGPILVRPQDATLISQLLCAGDGPLARAMTLLVSDASTEALGDHLRHFIQFTADGQSPRLLRFADPLVARHWLTSYGDFLPTGVAGPISAWSVAHWSPNWAAPEAVRWVTFERGAPSPKPSDITISHFLPAQLEGLRAAARWQFKERLTTHFSHYAPDAWQALATGIRGDWLDARLDEATTWGAVNERQLAIWIDLSLHWGADFMHHPDGLFQHWRQTAPDASTTPQQQILGALDVWRDTPTAQAIYNDINSTRDACHG
nr:DUF4123 domain-containing protein [uncultured Halomonas sp.]